jgi:hypothetical protein
MLYVGLDLSRKRLDWRAVNRAGERIGLGAVAPDRDASGEFGRRLGDTPVLAVIVSMSGATGAHAHVLLRLGVSRRAEAAAGASRRL